MFAALLAPSIAEAEIEASGVLGWRWFSQRSELGRYLDDPPETALVNNIALGMRIGWLPWPRWGIEGDLTVVPTRTADDRASVLVMAMRGQAVYNILTERVRPFVAVGAGMSFSSTSNPVWVLTDADADFHGGVGVRVDIGSDWGLRADMRVTGSPGQSERPVVGVEAFVSLYGRFPWQLAAEAPTSDPNDDDGDGVANAVDKCPQAAGAVTREGCPGAEKSDDQVDAEQKERKLDGAKPAPQPPEGGKP